MSASGSSGKKGRLAKVEPKPTHKKCFLCIYFDDDVDPVAASIHGPHSKILMHWGKPVGPNGEVPGRYCGYCVKVYCGLFHGVEGMSMTLYANLLGEHQLIEQHQKMVELTVQRCIKKGTASCHVDWENLEEEAVSIVNTSKVLEEAPGFVHWEKTLYEGQHGTFPDNGKASQGHFEYTTKAGIVAVCIPAEKKTNIKFIDEAVVERRRKVSLSGDLTDNQQITRLSMLQTLVTPGKLRRRGGVGGMVSAMLQDQLPAQSDTAIDLSSSGNARPSMRDEQPASSGPFTTPSPRKNLQSPTAQEPPTGGKTPVLPKAKAGAKKKGRPPIDYDAKVSQLRNTFYESPPTDPCWWGSEAITQQKYIGNLKKDIVINTNAYHCYMSLPLQDVVAIVICHCPCLCLALLPSIIIEYHHSKEIDEKNKKQTIDPERARDNTKLSKQLWAMIAIVKIVADHGLDSDEFKKTYDLVETQLELEPQAILDMPAHVKFARLKHDLRHIGDAQRFLLRITSDELKKNGATNLSDEQASCFATRLTLELKRKEYADTIAGLRALFSMNIDWELYEDQLSEFAVCMEVLANIKTYQDLQERIEMLSDALHDLEGMIPCETSAGTLLGATLTAQPRGRRILENAKTHLAHCKQSTVHLVDLANHREAFFDSFKVDLCLLDVSPAETEISLKALDVLLDKFSSCTDNVLEDFRPKPRDPELAQVCNAWCAKIMSAMKRLLLPVLTHTTDEQCVWQWLQSHKQSRQRLLSLGTHTVSAQVMFTLPVAKSCQVLMCAINWFESAELVVSQSVEEDMDPDFCELCSEVSKIHKGWGKTPDANIEPWVVEALQSNNCTHTEPHLPWCPLP